VEELDKIVEGRKDDERGEARPAIETAFCGRIEGKE